MKVRISGVVLYSFRNVLQAFSVQTNHYATKINITVINKLQKELLGEFSIIKKSFLRKLILNKL